MLEFFKQQQQQQENMPDWLLTKNAMHFKHSIVLTRSSKR